MVANRTAQVDQIRGLLDEFGLVVPKGVPRLRRELPGILEDAADGLPELAREVLAGLLDQLFQDFAARRLMQVVSQDMGQAKIPAKSDSVVNIVELRPAELNSVELAVAKDEPFMISTANGLTRAGKPFGARAACRQPMKSYSDRRN
jgi:hypothetical protein